MATLNFGNINLSAGGSSGPITTAQISDSTAAGRSVLTGTAEQARQAIGAAAGASAATGYCYVDAVTGNDSSGARNSPALPFATIAAAIAAATSGDIIQISAGTYVGATVSKSNLWLKGAGARATIVSFSGTSCGLRVSASITDTRVTDMGFDGGRTTTTDASSLGNEQGVGVLVYSGCSRTWIERCRIVNPLGHALFFVSSSTDCVVEKCSLESVATSSGLVTVETRYGILNFGGLNHRYSCNYLTGFCQAVGLWYGAKWCRIDANKIVDNWGRLGASADTPRSACEDYGGAVEHGYNTWESNYVSGSTSHGFEIAEGTLRSVVRGNYITNVTGDCVEITSTNTNPTTEITLDNNFYIGGGGSTTYSGVMINGLGANGVRIFGGLFRSFGSGSFPILIGGTKTGGGFQIDGCRFEGCNSNGAIVFLNNNGDGIVISNLMFIGSINASPQVFLASGNYHTVKGCSAVGMGAYSNQRLVYATAGNGHTIAGNIASRETSGAGMIVITAGSGHNITGNTIYWYSQGWNVGAIQIGSSVSNSLCTSNNITGLSSGVSAGIYLSGTNNRANNNLMSNAFAYSDPSSTGCIAVNGADSVRPVVNLSESKTFSYADLGVIHKHPAADTTARTWTIDSDASFKVPIGTVLTFYNEVGAGTITISVTTDTLTASPSGTPGPYSLLAAHKAKATKVAATSWVIEGN